MICRFSVTAYWRGRIQTQCLGDDAVQAQTCRQKLRVTHVEIMDFVIYLLCVIGSERELTKESHEGGSHRLTVMTRVSVTPASQEICAHLPATIAGRLSPLSHIKLPVDFAFLYEVMCHVWFTSSVIFLLYVSRYLIEDQEDYSRSSQFASTSAARFRISSRASLLLPLLEGVA